RDRTGPPRASGAGASEGVTSDGAPFGSRHWRHRDGGHAGSGGALPETPRPTGRGALCRPHGLAGRERQEATREGASQGGQCSSAPLADPTRLALFTVPKGQRTGAMVSGAARRPQGGAQDDDDRGPRSETADRAVALGHDRRNPGRRCVAGGGLSAGGGRATQTHSFGAQSRFRDWPSITSRGGGDPNNSMASMPSAEWARRLGASPSKRMTASWSGSNTDPTEYKVAARCFAP